MDTDQERFNFLESENDIIIQNIEKLKEIINTSEKKNNIIHVEYIKEKKALIKSYEFSLFHNIVCMNDLKRYKSVNKHDVDDFNRKLKQEGYSEDLRMLANKLFTDKDLFKKVGLQYLSI